MMSTPVQEATIKQFQDLVKNYFSFLIEDYQYEQPIDLYDQKDHYRDKTYIIRYKNNDMMVEVSWHFAGSVIDVVFIAPVNQAFEGKRSVFPSEDPSTLNMIDIYTLGHYLKNSDELLLQDTHVATLEAVRTRYQVIQDNLKDIIFGLAQYTKNHATSILAGDTTLFDPLMGLYQELINQQYPFNVF